MTLELQSYTQQKKIPGPPALPILGTLPFLYKHQHLVFTELAEKYGNIFQVRVFGRNIVVLNGLETIRQAFLKQSEDFAGRPDVPIVKKIINGNNIGGREYGLLWKRHREIVINAMHMFVVDKTTTFEQQVKKDTIELVNILLSYKGQPFIADMEIYLSISNIMAKILFGEKYSRNNPDLIALIKMVQTINRVGNASMLMLYGPQPPDFLINFASSIGTKLVSNTLKEHKKSYDPTNLRGMADALLKAINEIDDSEKQTLGLTEELVVDGTAQEIMMSSVQAVPVIAWALLYMIAYPDIQAQVQEELDRVIGREQTVGYDDRLKLPFTQACIHEIWRHAVYFSTALPHAATRDTSINGYFIPKDTPVYVNLYGLTRDPRYWEEPEIFNPRRFLSKTGEVREELLDLYYPFGLGKRRCFAEYLGRQEIFIFFANLMHRCKFTKVPGAKLSFESQKGATTLPKQRYQVIVNPRF
ncbi:MAG: cytochrome P450 [Scytonema sp. CRU_2_7]|nr:cytochrome P450 [Scytonema sp. CRU_2_7]